MRVVERDCPTCQSPVNVHAGQVEEHRAFFGRTGPGAVNGHTVQIAERCPASGESYTLLLKAEVFLCAL